jgi:aryl-alcohol dehydrogenase-like predicted oxidoreductase
VELRRLGASGLDVSRLSLGSWRTYERMSRQDGAAVMRAARDAGVNFLDDARYDDETGTAPMRTGYSEVIFGELFREVGWRREETVVANKLWWEFWPGQTAADELDGSLTRMGLDYVDLIYANPPAEGLGLEELVESVTGLVAAGRARAWGIVNWPAGMIAEASSTAARLGVPQPCAAQLAYNLVHRSPVEDTEMTAALAACGAPVVASYVLAGGVLTGKYADPSAAGRAKGTLDDPRVALAAGAAMQLAQLARSIDASPAALAIAFVLANPSVATALIGATSPAQLRQNLAAVDLVGTLDDAQLNDLRKVGRPS